MQKHLKNGTHAVKHVGWSASLLRELKPADWRAFLGAELVADGLTIAAACAVSGASVGYVNTLLRISPQEREAVLDGSVSLASLHLRKRTKVVAEAKIEPTANMIAVGENHGSGRNHGGLSDSVVENIVREVVWRAVDRITQPELPLVAAE